jgi:glycosyl hydrolase family 2/Ig-like domain-containing protein/concanavalin A-like lectin/glucanase superfamily protein
MRALLSMGVLFVGLSGATAQEPGHSPTTRFGPYNATFLAGGIGIEEPLAPDSTVSEARAPWSLSGWMRVEHAAAGRVIVAALGDVGLVRTSCRCLVLDQGHLALEVGASTELRASRPIDNAWHALAATYDGHVAKLYLDGARVDSKEVATGKVTPVLHLAPQTTADLTGEHHFGGSLAHFQIHAQVLDAGTVGKLSAARPDFTLIPFQKVGVGWPWQEHAWRGLLEPQPAWTLPHGNAPPSPPVRDIRAADTLPLQPHVDNRWIVGGWHMMPAPAGSEASAAAPAPSGARPRLSGEALSSSAYGEDNWYPAIVPGTALTTLIANGVYPDPDYGLNNLVIPESLNQQDYWYRSHFVVPADLQGKHLTLTFNGINYDADVWLNGVRLGHIRGAFVRGVFDISSTVKFGTGNALAVRVSPPPHPGIPHEQSVAAGPGQNGGNLAIDGPTFIATEGWDWIPGIRDRNTGIWQNVELSASGELRILDPQIVTTLPLPRTDSADLIIHIPVENRGGDATNATIEAEVAGVHVSKSVMLPPGTAEVVLAPAEFPQLRLAHPNLWWPNGYGKQNFYTARLAVTAVGGLSDSKSVRFGIREITYELSLFDHEGKLRRVEVDPAEGSVRHERLVDVRHEAIKQTANGWAASLTIAGESSPAVRDIDTTSLTPYLAIRVNGVRIAARGGSWGMDDSRKRVGRERLEPYFRLHRNAHLNIIRNWLGQDTEEVFYDLADEYGLLILNDFWESTQNFQLEAQDPQLFLQNARDVIRRYRNHPSIAVWFGRNEGVPQPIINEGLADAVATLDGTRYYTGSSNTINLQGSGPYNWRPAEGYFTTLAQGFSVEVGTPSLASAESLRASIPAADLWPIGDTYAYHDWHFGGNGDIASFTQAMDTGLGAPTGFEDFERKAQLMDYESYRAVFEGFQAHLWTRNSGRLLWMTHPSWPSNTWQIYTSDYDTAAAYYAVTKACEPVHAQLDLPDYRLTVVNTTRETQRALRLHTRVVSLGNHALLTRIDKVDAPADDTVTLDPLDLHKALDKEGVVLVELSLTDAKGTLLSRNIYWPSRSNADLGRLSKLPEQPLILTSSAGKASAQGTSIELTLQNRGKTPALMAKLTLLDATGNRVLPAYYTDNYVTLLPGESRNVEVSCPAGGKECAAVTLRGWNVTPARHSLSKPP